MPHSMILSDSLILGSYLKSSEYRITGPITVWMRLTQHFLFLPSESMSLGS